MLEKRIVSFIALIFIIVAAIYVDWHKLLPFTLCGLIITVFIILGLYEFFTMLENKGINSYKYFGTAVGTIIPLSIVFRFELTKGWELFFIVLMLLFLIVMQFRRRNNSGVTVDISTTLFGILYVAWFFSFLIKIIYLPSGLAFLIAVLLMTKLGDVGAYLVGSRIGKTPLLPHISPKKTVEGSFGGLIFSVVGALICKPLINFSYVHLVFLGIGLNIIGQLGDLSESLIKRDCGVKDSGKVLPGMGGILDEIDSLLFTAPVFYFYMTIILG
ncbi:MAG: phosphatidate cytidylyltransferase [Candidatus Omnitrophica bacterium]|nr:phosphatidate cytidylyltransferase [Candidatus Omnitrophota bacterium]